VDGAKRTKEPATDSVVDPKHSINIVTNLVDVAYAFQLFDVIPLPRIFETSEKQQISKRSGLDCRILGQYPEHLGSQYTYEDGVDGVVRKHKWRWKNVETEPPRHVDAGKEVGEGGLSSRILALDHQTLFVQHSGYLKKIKGLEVLSSCSTGRDDNGRVCGGFSRSKAGSRGSATEASQCYRGKWEGMGGPPRRGGPFCPSLGRRRGTVPDSKPVIQGTE
jgi:hypothetical protein